MSTTEPAPAIPSSDNVSREAAKAALAAAERILAQHRRQPLADLLAKVQAADLAGIAKLTAEVIPDFTRDQDKILFTNAANTIAEYEKLITSTIEANDRLAAV